LKSLSELERNVTKYVLKNLPSGLPVVSKYMQNYIKALLSSGLIRDSFDKLDSYFESGLRFDNEAGWVQEDSMHFILRDFCSVVGVVYKPEYQEAILRSLVCKGTSFLFWFFLKYFGFPVLSLSTTRSGVDTAVSATDELGETDAGLFTDLSVSGYLDIEVFFDSEHEDVFYQKLEEYKELLSLVIPARLVLRFSFQ